MFEFLNGRLLAVRILMLLTALSLAAVGIATIYAIGNPAAASVSLQNTKDFAALGDYWQKQLAFLVLAIFAFAAVNMVNYRALGYLSYWLFAGILLLLAMLLFSKYIYRLPFVPEINGAYAWIRLPYLLAIQPSEFCKIIYILALAWYLRYRSNYRNFSALIGPLVFTFIPIILIILEPDIGTVALMMPILFMMLLAAGAKIKHLVLIMLIAVMVSPAFWFFMKPYQRMRISSFMLQNQYIQQKLEEHPKAAKLLLGTTFSARKWESDWGFHLIRSKYAVASGFLSGNGYGRGPFIEYNFLPYRHNDFIFAIIAHQWGFLGSLGMIILYVILISCGLEIASGNTDPYGRLVAVGITTLFAIEIVVNISMSIGLMPITGITLPFVSYGGSSLLVSFIAIGLLNNVGRCRPFNLARSM